MKYNDPSGHCAVTEQGSPDPYNDGECWQWAFKIYGGWDHTDYWSKMWPDGKDFFLKNLASDPLMGADYFQNEFVKGSQTESYQTWAAQNQPRPTPQEYLDDPMCGGEGVCQAVGSGIKHAKQKCQQIDCVGIGNDVVGVAGAGMVLSAPVCPACAVVGGYLGTGSTAFGVGWTAYNWYNDRSSEADLAVTAELAYRGLTTKSKPWGLAYSVIQLAWDTLVSPNDPWE